MDKYTYLLINAGTIIVPLAFSFERRLGFSNYWKALFPALFITAGFFIIWDHYLTAWGVWSFNPDYLIGVYIWGLPLEEWLFFFTVPYACVFTYSSLNVLLKDDPFKHSARNISAIWFVIVSVIALTHTDKLYTGIKLSLTALMLAYVWFRNYPWLGRFIRAYLVSLVPFLVVNGLLTYLPVVQYNDQENLGIRIISIPVEDTQYTLLLLLMNITLFEYFKKRYHLEPAHLPNGNGVERID
jgi:lycopene cyclase domain-containing protein